MFFRNEAFVVYSTRSQEGGDGGVIIHHSAFAQPSFAQAIAEMQQIHFFNLIGENFTDAHQELRYETLVSSDRFLISPYQPLLLDKSLLCLGEHYPARGIGHQRSSRRAG